MSRICLLILVLLFTASCNRVPKQVAVSSGDKYATEVAMDILKKGGTVIDAFIAANLVLTMTEPGASGIGGGFLAVYYDANKSQFFSVDARETQAFRHHDLKALKLELEKEKWSDSKAAIGIPGELAGMALLYQEFGTKPINDLIDPAIEIAKDGFIASEYYIKSHKKFNMNPEVKAGELVYSHDYLKTLEILKKKGLMSFYSGEIASAIEEYTEGWITRLDLQNYRAFLEDL